VKGLSDDPGQRSSALPPENVFGHTKKVRLIRESLARLRAELARPIGILDLGCGNGRALTRFLGEPRDRVLGIDSHGPSLAYARRHFAVEGIEFREGTAEELGNVTDRFDVVILADVLEHVTEPDKLLSAAARLLLPGGRVLLTVPNGHGPFEIESAIGRVPLLGRLSLKAVDYFVAFLNRFVFRGAWSRAVGDAAEVPYNEESGHVQFFTRKRILGIARDAGLEEMGQAGLSWLSGPYSNYLFGASRRFCEWNTRVAASLPSWAVSGWLFELRKRR